MRTDDDLGMGIVVVGSIVLALLIAVLPGFPHGPFPGSLVMSLLVVVFGFFFVTVASRIVGIIGTSSNPISGMTIATLMGTCVVFVLIGRTGEAYQPVALCVGALVCIAAANAGATSQDLKTGYLVGATPRRQQIGFIIGVLVSTLVIGGTLFLLDSTYAGGEAHGIGGAKLAAPQATLMATIIKGLLAQNLPWAPVLVGVFLAFMAQMAGAHALSWAVGAYLPLSTTLPIFIGGQMKALADKMRHKKEESELSSGMLYATGLVAGGSLGGVLIAVVTAAGDIPLVKRLLAAWESRSRSSTPSTSAEGGTATSKTVSRWRCPLRGRLRPHLSPSREERAEGPGGLRPTLAFPALPMASVRVAKRFGPAVILVAAALVFLYFYFVDPVDVALRAAVPLHGGLRRPVPGLRQPARAARARARRSQGGLDVQRASGVRRCPLAGALLLFSPSEKIFFFGSSARVDLSHDPSPFRRIPFTVPFRRHENVHR